MKKLLVAVDGSGAAQRALAQAIALARMNPDASIHLVHAHEEPDVYGEIAVYVPRPKMEELQRTHSEAVLAAAEEGAGLKNCGVRYTKEVLIGPIGQTIARHAERLGCDAIVMGRHGKSTVGELFMGSVAMKVVHLTRLPVLLVR
jgi:nucleotide-binding universal stress UspA family protein